MAEEGQELLSGKQIMAIDCKTAVKVNALLCLTPL